MSKTTVQRYTIRTLFHKVGAEPNYLSRYADPKRSVRATETNPPERVSDQPPEARQEAYYAPVFSSGGGRSC